jgi:hypothetical protein
MPKFLKKMITYSRFFLLSRYLRSISRMFTDNSQNSFPGLVANQLLDKTRLQPLGLLLALIIAIALPTADGQAAPVNPSRSPNLTPVAQPSPPPALLQATIQDLARRTKISAKQIQVKSATAKTWPNGCLGLARQEEMCTQMLVSGWQIVLGHGQHTWRYRIDQTGKNLRLES